MNPTVLDDVAVDRKSGDLLVFVPNGDSRCDECGEDLGGEIIAVS
jgi:hypothetical protein